MTIKPIRYYVYNPNETYVASYNAALGKDALSWAKQNAQRYHGRIMTEFADGTLKLEKSYELAQKPDQKSV